MSRRRKRKEENGPKSISSHLSDSILGPLIIRSIRLLEEHVPTGNIAQGGGDDTPVSYRDNRKDVRIVDTVIEMSTSDFNFLSSTKPPQMIIRVSVINGTETRPRAGHVVPPEDPKSLIKEVRNGEP